MASGMCQQSQIPHLDLDTIAWLPCLPPRRRSVTDSMAMVTPFIEANQQWGIEGCYCDLLEQLLPHITQMIFMDLSIEDCIINAKNRPWEPHKYQSKALQDENLTMLCDWITQYEKREDAFSLQSHLELFSSFNGYKQRISRNIAVPLGNA